MADAVTLRVRLPWSGLRIKGAPPLHRSAQAELKARFGARAAPSSAKGH